MDSFSGLIYGFQITFQPINFIFCFIGVFVGTLIGVLPGIGPIGAMSILLPLTFTLSPVPGIIMLSGIYYGAMYGGSTTSILVNIPGEAASVVTCLDGYRMARKGRAGPALGISAFGSFIGGTASLVILVFAVRPLAVVALRFGPPEYFALMFLGLALVTYLAKGSFLKAISMAVIGLFLGCVGMDQFRGTLRFNLGISELSEGIGLVPLAMGLFGISEILTNIQKTTGIDVFKTEIKNLFPTLDDWKRSIGPIIRGTFLGFFLGILPGGGGVISSFASYMVEKKISKHPEEFGFGAIEGVAGPETANNAATAGAFVPLLSLGIPPNIVMAFIMGALLVHGITPGPFLVNQNPEIFWGIISSMYLGNVMLIILNVPVIPLWVRLLKVPYKILFPLILLFCLIGVYSVRHSTFDILVMCVFGVVGYIMNKYEYEGAPLLLAFILGPLVEYSFRQSLVMSDGDLLIFFTRPISAVAIGLTIVILISRDFNFFRLIKKKFA